MTDLLSTASWSLSTVHALAELIAAVAFALSGVMEAARKRLDAVGVCVVAGVTAFGGGTLRDVLLDRRPFFWVGQPNLVWAVLLLCVLAMFFRFCRDKRVLIVSADGV